MNVYILTFDIDKDAFIRALDEATHVRNWFAFLPTAIAYASTLDLTSNALMLQERFPHHQFILVPAEPRKTAGLLPRNVWQFINEPWDSGKHPPYNNFLKAMSDLTFPKSGLPNTGAESNEGNALIPPGSANWWDHYNK